MSAGISDVASAVHASLRRRGETVAVAESLTGGLLGAALSDEPGASQTFRGALVVYATDLKATLAGVPAELLAAEGPVARSVAVALARGARERCLADWGVGVTGVAGPETSGGQPVGTVWVGVADGSAAPHAVAGHFRGGRADVRAAAVGLALRTLLDMLAAREAAP
ncbi:MAG: CinA family protein [Actinomycetota bacterium]|nr:CinA family protein [Actinomycetota bacterium]